VSKARLAISHLRVLRSRTRRSTQAADWADFEVNAHFAAAGLPYSFVLKSNIRMIKLYLKTKSVMRYHEAWISGAKVVEHWGVVGDRGESREHKKDRKKSDEENILDVLADPLAKGFLPIDDDGFDVLMIEYAIDGMGNKKDLKKRYDLEDRMNETLGWTGLGNCDGGSTGSGTMEVCCFVVDFKTAKRVIEKDLSESKFSDF